MPWIAVATSQGQIVNTISAICVNPELEALRQLVADARAQLAQLQTDYTKEKSRLDAVQAALFRRLREHYQKRDQLRLIIAYRRKCLGALLRGDAEEAKQAEKAYEQAKRKTDKDYDDLAAEKKSPLTADQEAELTRLWKKLVKLYHPDRFAGQPDKPGTYGKLTAAINIAKHTGDVETLREIAEDPHGFILRQGWECLDLTDAVELGELRRLYEALQLEITDVLESLRLLRASPGYELCQLSDRKPGVLDELAAERANVLEKENTDLKNQADRLAGEIRSLAGEARKLCALQPAQGRLAFCRQMAILNQIRPMNKKRIRNELLHLLCWLLLASFVSEFYPILSAREPGGDPLATWLLVLAPYLFFQLVRSVIWGWKTAGKRLLSWIALVLFILSVLFAPWEFRGRLESYGPLFFGSGEGLRLCWPQLLCTWVALGVIYLGLFSLLKEPKAKPAPQETDSQASA